MALIKCPECKKKVSDQTNQCPNCGRTITDADKELAIEQNKKSKSIKDSFNRDYCYVACRCCRWCYLLFCSREQ